MSNIILHDNDKKPWPPGIHVVICPFAEDFIDNPHFLTVIFRCRDCMKQLKMHLGHIAYCAQQRNPIDTVCAPCAKGYEPATPVIVEVP